MFKAGKPCVSILNNPLLLLSLLLPLSQAALSQTREASSRLVDCKYISPDGARYDFTSLIGTPDWPLNLTSTRSTPPTTTVETLIISLCKPLAPLLEGCPDGTTVCMSIFNQPGDKGSQDRRLISRIPLAGPTPPTAEGGGHTERVLITAPGGSYNGVQQSTIFNLSCVTSANPTRQPSTLYDPLRGVLTIDWPTSLACASSADGSPAKTPVHPGGWFGSFVTFIFLLFLAYLLLGVWINYSQYGGSGWDLIPHQEFWRGLPTRIYDLFCAKTGRGTASRAGYAAI